jgi:hypothetical protein
MSLATVNGCLDEIEAAWSERAKADPAFPQGVSFERGQPDDMTEHETFPRVRWVFGVGSISPSSGRELGQLGTRKMRLQARVWAEDAGPAEQMCLALIGIAADALSPGRFDVLGEDWTIGDGRTGEGFVVALTFQLTVPFCRLPPNGVVIGGVSIRKDIDQ